MPVTFIFDTHICAPRGSALLQPVAARAGLQRSSLSDDNGVDRRFTSFHLLFKPLLFTSHSTSRR